MNVERTDFLLHWADYFEKHNNKKAASLARETVRYVRSVYAKVRTATSHSVVCDKLRNLLLNLDVDPQIRGRSCVDFFCTDGKVRVINGHIFLAYSGREIGNGQEVTCLPMGKHLTCIIQN